LNQIDINQTDKEIKDFLEVYPGFIQQLKGSLPEIDVKRAKGHVLSRINNFENNGHAVDLRDH